MLGIGIGTLFSSFFFFLCFFHRLQYGFLLGTAEFQKKVTNPIQDKFELNEVRDHKYRFSGVEIEDTEEGIEINRRSYCNNLQEIKIGLGRDNNRPLLMQELTEFRKTIGMMHQIYTGKKDQEQIPATMFTDIYSTKQV